MQLLHMYPASVSVACHFGSMCALRIVRCAPHIAVVPKAALNKLPLLVVVVFAVFIAVGAVLPTGN